MPVADRRGVGAATVRGDMSMVERGIGARMRRTGCVASLVLALLAWVGPQMAPHARADTAPGNSALATTVSSDPLPTVQIDGVVWAQVIVGNTVYVGGNFTTARPAGAPPGTATVARSNLLAYDLTTGKLIEAFDHALNGQVRSFAVAPDQKTLYVGGQFTTVNGVNRYRIAAFDVASGALKSFFLSPNASVYGLAVTDTTLYLAGIFNVVNGVTRSGAAAVAVATGAVQPFAVAPAGGAIRQVVVSPDKSKVALGGGFTSLNGSSNPGYGLALVNASSGATLPMPTNTIVRNGTDRAAVYSLIAAPEGFYGSGYTSDLTVGNFEGAFRSDWSGNLQWLEDCHGDTYSVALSGDALYVAGHPHSCGSAGAFPEPVPRTSKRALAFTRKATGVLGTDPHGYYNFAGQPAPTQLNWYPDLNAGTFTGQSQGPWSVAANDSYVVYGGEFTAVNGKPQQGLVRFAKSALAPNTDGPRLGGSALGLRVRAYGTALRLSWPANWDRDNERLTYRLYRDNAVIHETSADSTFYRRPVLSFVDRDRAAGRTYSYKVRTSDPFGNVTWSSDVSGAPGSGPALTPYQSRVLADGPESYWPMNDGVGTSMADLTGNDNGTHGSAVTTGGGSAIVGEPGTSFRFAGTPGTSTASDSVAQVAPQNFSSEAWFRTTSTTGGQILGFDRLATGGSGYADRHLYLSNDGRVFFAVRPANIVKSVNSSTSYRDGKWHHVVGTLSAEGLRLYVDGALVGKSADTNQAMHFGGHLGYWRIGGDPLTGLPSRPTSDHLAGYYDEVAVYPVALSAAQIQEHYTRGTSGAPANAAPHASFSATTSSLRVDLDGSASSDPDGAVASYAWDFGDGTTGTGRTASHTYSAAGTYPVKLVVTDDRGALSSAVTEQVTVTEPPNQAPTAAFSVAPTDLTVALDAAASQDPDGSVTKYVWKFGDGTSGTGATVHHTYATSGSYAVELTVTDNGGATGSTTKVLSVSDGTGPFIRDDFDRSVSSGLGTAEVGGSWTTSASTGFAVADGAGVFSLSAPTVNRSAYLAEAKRDVSDTRLSFTTDKAATGAGIYATISGRRVSAKEEYRLNVRLSNTNTVVISIGALHGSSTNVPLSSSVTLPGTYQPGTDIHVRLAVRGTSPTTITGKAWLGKEVEPTGWAVSATDNYSNLQAPGAVGFGAYLSSSATNAPLAVKLATITATR